MEKTLKDYLSDPRISQIARDAIRKWDLSGEAVWNKNLTQLKEDFAGEIGKGFEKLYAMADTGDWYYPLYSEEECEELEDRRGVNLVRFASEDPAAASRPFILLVPGGGFVNVWNLTEGWPVAAQFNALGYHVFILTYQVQGEDGLLKRNMEDFARALKLISANAERFGVQGDRYITCGFSAGGYLVCLWNTEIGYRDKGLPKPEAVFPVYPVVTLKDDNARYEGIDPEEAMWLYGCDMQSAVEGSYEIPEHAEGFPPCAVFVAAGDELVNPENSKILARTLDRLGIPCRLEIGPTGGHGFADGSGMCMAGWTERAVRWYESLKKDN